MQTTKPPEPAAIESEQGLLGSILLDASILMSPESKLRLGKADFYRAVHGDIYQAMLDLRNAKVAPDLNTVIDRLSQDGKLEKVGGFAYLCTLLNSVSSAAHYLSYATLIKDAAWRRKSCYLGEQFAGLGYNGHGPEERSRLIGSAKELLSELESARSGIQDRARGISAQDLMRADLPRLRWLVEDLIIRPGLTILGGQPKAGKSWLALQTARGVSRGGPVLTKATEAPGPVIYYALEDGPARLQNRLFKACWDETQDVTFYFGDELPPLDDGGMAVLESDIGESRPALVVIDSLAAAKTGRLDENDGGQVAELMYKLSRLCHSYDLSILLVHHHRKATTGSPLADLRGSGALGGAADAILALYREREAPESKLALDSRDAEGNSWTLGFTDFSWAMLGDGELADQKRAERKISKALRSLGNAGGTLEEIINTVEGLRRESALNALKALTDRGEAMYKDIAQEGRGRPRRVWYLGGVF